jgi:lipoprotein-releasing system permease protein
MAEPTGTHPFAPYEWMLSLRYLRARRKEGFISVIAGFSFLGIMLGVATLIIVMAVMNGFRTELLDKILGLNGHLLIQPLESPLTDCAKSLTGVEEGVTLAAPGRGASACLLVQRTGRVGARAPGADLAKLPSIGSNVKRAPRRICEGQGLAIGRRLADTPLASGRETPWSAPRGSRHSAPRRASRTTRSRPSSRSVVSDTTPPSYSCHSRGAGLLQPLGRRHAIEVYTSSPDRPFRTPHPRRRPLDLHRHWRQRNATSSTRPG